MSDNRTMTPEQAVEKLRKSTVGELIDDIEGEGVIRVSFAHENILYTLLIGKGDAAQTLYRQHAFSMALGKMKIKDQ